MPQAFRYGDYAKISRVVPVAHGEAFKLMRYTCPNLPDLWIWNSRDGVTPYGLGEPKNYRHAMHAYLPIYSAVLPDQATHVFVDYDRSSWEEFERKRYEFFANLPDGEFGGDTFRERNPTVDDWLKVVSFEPGQPRLMTRAEWLAWTPSYAAGLVA